MAIVRRREGHRTVPRLPEMSAEYELILMLDPEIPDERREEIAGNARERIDSAGTLRHSDTWGLRKLAYEIRQRTEADYRFYRFEAEPPLLSDLDHTLKITDGILRFRLFKVDPRAPLIEPAAVSQLGASRGGRRDERGRGRRRDEGVDEVAEGAEEAPPPEAAAPQAEDVVEPSEERVEGPPAAESATGEQAPEPDDSAVQTQASESPGR
jgi:small subunit ribosomal protein S6